MKNETICNSTTLTAASFGYATKASKETLRGRDCRAANIVQKIDEDIKPSVAFYPNPEQDFITINNIGYK